MNPSQFDNVHFLIKTSQLIIIVNMKKVFSIILLFCILFAFLEQCKHESTEPKISITKDTTQRDTINHNLPDTTYQAPNTGDSVCFNTQILPMMISNCAMSKCHDIASHQKGYNLTTYSNISRYGYPIFNSMNNGKMPQNRPAMTSAQKALFLKWLSEGARNVFCDTSSCDTSNVTYTSSIQPIIQNYCLGCHTTSSANSSGGGIILDSYSAVKTNAQTGHLLCSVQWTGTCYKMPKNVSQLTSCNIRKFLIWANNNFPQ